MAAHARLAEMVPSAYLRVYQPLDGFERDEQLHWERYLVDRMLTPDAKPRYRDHVTAGRLGLLAPSTGEHADIRVVDGRTYVSPRRMRMRALAAMLSFREAEPMDLWEQFVTKQMGKRAARELSRMRRRSPDSVPFCHQSPWHVPIRWFVFFHDSERRLKEDEQGRIRLRYTASVRRAMRRAELAIPALRRSELGPIGELILDLHQWMAAFDPGSLLELDYADLCDLLTWDELDDDHSARDIHEALDALDQGEYPRSADAYQGVLTRWAEVRSREILN
jgi:hypothetical protein